MAPLTVGLLCLAMLLFSAGCGGQNPLGRQAVSGTVTLNGKPLDQGKIDFEPQGDAEIATGAVIWQGKFEIDRLKGMPPGKYLVRIFSTGARGNAASASDAPLGPPGPESARQQVELIPARYNAQSQVMVEVEKNKEAVFPFELQSP